MTASGIFRSSNGALKVLTQQPYESEALLQQALAKYPAVLAGGTTAGEEPRPLMLIKREMGVAKEDGGSDWWSLDHLFVDADGIPVFVEVKQSSNTEIRRRIVAQMLDYAA